MLAAAGRKAWADLGPLDAIKAASFLTCPPYSQGTVHEYRGNLRRVLRDLGRPELAATVPRAVAPGPRRRVTHAAEFEPLIAKARPALRLWLLLCHDAALRSLTAFRLSPTDYVPATQTITVATKRGRIAVVPATRRLAAMLAILHPFAVRQSCSYIDAANGRHMAITQLRAAFITLARSQGISDLRAHDLRRTAANQVLTRSGDLRCVQSLLSHVSLGSTFRYLDQPGRLTVDMLEPKGDS